MDPRDNPFAASAGVPPPQFAGRDDLIEKADIALDRRLAGRPAKDMIFLGLRGVGKTVLLNRLLALAKVKGYETIRLELPDAAGGHLARRLVPELNNVLRRLDRRRAAGERLRLAAAMLQNFAAVFKVKYEGISVGADPAKPQAATGDLTADLADLLVAVAEAAKARRTGVALFIDEVQNLVPEELGALSRAFHAVAQQGLPMVLMAAGLPHVAAQIGDLKSYAERQFLFPELGPLDPAAARSALAVPVEAQGVTFTPESLDRIVAQSGAYAFFLQTWGEFAWNEAASSPITAEDVRAAEGDILTHLDQNLFRVRFDRCTPLEQQYLRGMAELGSGPHQTGDIAAALGTDSARLAAVRRNLIAAGLIYSQRHGETAFTIPLFDGFMRRMMPDLVPYTPGKRRTP